MIVLLCNKSCCADDLRAPLLVAVALVEKGMKYDEAINRIREKRRGAINAKQLKWLKTYEPQKSYCLIS